MPLGLTLPFSVAEPEVIPVAAVVVTVGGELTVLHVLVMGHCFAKTLGKL